MINWFKAQYYFWKQMLFGGTIRVNSGRIVSDGDDRLLSLWNRCKVFLAFIMGLLILGVCAFLFLRTFDLGVIRGILSWATLALLGITIGEWVVLLGVFLAGYLVGRVHERKLKGENR